MYCCNVMKQCKLADNTVVIRWRQELLTHRANHVASSLRARTSVEKLTTQIEREYNWTSAKEIATRALVKFTTPTKRKAAAAFIRVDQVSTFTLITVYAD